MGSSLLCFQKGDPVSVLLARLYPFVFFIILSQNSRFLFLGDALKFLYSRDLFRESTRGEGGNMGDE